MAKFKCYLVDTYQSIGLLKELVHHAEYLGYENVKKPFQYYQSLMSADSQQWFILDALGNWRICNKRDPSKKNLIDHLTSLDDFFNLTPEDVIDEIELFGTRFTIKTELGQLKSEYNYKLTESQINRIVEIIKEHWH